MARARNIKPGFFMNESLAECSFEARLLFIGLWTLADREGRLEDRPKRIKAELFPFDSLDVEPMLTRLQAEGFLSRYEIGKARFIQIENFVKHQDPHYKEKASQIPPPPGRENLVLASGVTRTQRARIYERDGYKCVACGVEDGLCIDHIMPVSRGGDSSDENLQTLCMSCNTKKGNKLDGEEKNSRQRRVNVGSSLPQRNDASPSDSLIPDSGFLIPDSLNQDTHTTPVQPVVPPTAAGRACLLLRKSGIPGVSPGHPKLLALLAAGVTDEELTHAAESAVAKGKGFAYAMGALEAQRNEAAAMTLHRGPLPGKAAPAPNAALSAERTAAMLAEQAARTPEAPSDAIREKLKAAKGAAALAGLAVKVAA